MHKCHSCSTHIFLATVATGALLWMALQTDIFSEPVLALKITKYLHYQSAKPIFRKPDYLGHIYCQRLFQGDEKYINDLLYPNIFTKWTKRIRWWLGEKMIPRIVARELPFESSCRKLRYRIIGPYPAPILNYSIAFARNVYTDYESLEILLSATYSPENHYCYHVDLKSPQKFKDQIAKLEECFPNVYLVKENYNTTSEGKNNNAAHMKCMEILLEMHGWEHLILLQVILGDETLQDIFPAHDLVAHTNSELMNMLKLLNGTNDSNIDHMRWRRVQSGIAPNLQDLNFWTNYTTLTLEERKNAKLEFARGLEEATYIRAAVHWLVKEINVTTLMNYFNDGHSQVDEQLFATLLNSETLRMPGGYHSSCLNNSNQDDFFTYITRHTRWSFNKHKNCNNRHGICVYGIEDLNEARINARRVISLNKFLGSFDFAAIVCMAESLFNRTHYGDEAFDVQHIANHSGNRYQRATHQPGFDLNNFTCKGI
ncbi:unnamed protein product, partial [Mesorhabditis spiculigera]